MSNWTMLEKEPLGMVRSKVWVTNGKHTALFKPDFKPYERNKEIKELVSESKAQELIINMDTYTPESKIEYEFYLIAKELGISCAKIKIIDLFGMSGCLSYNIATKEDIIYCHASELTQKSRNSNNNTLHPVNNLSFIPLINKAPYVLEQMVNMMYIDCLVCNTDRHGSNWKLEMNLENKIHSVAPIFDHGYSMALTNHTLTDGLSQVIWDDESLEMNHFNLFNRLAKHSPELVKKLLDKTESIYLPDKVKLRFKIMKGIYN